MFVVTDKQFTVRLKGWKAVKYKIYCTIPEIIGVNFQSLFTGEILFFVQN